MNILKKYIYENKIMFKPFTHPKSNKKNKQNRYRYSGYIKINKFNSLEN